MRVVEDSLALRQWCGQYLTNIGAGKGQVIIWAYWNDLGRDNLYIE